MGVPNQNSERPTQPGRGQALDSLLKEVDGKSRTSEGFVIRPVEILRLLDLTRDSKNMMNLLRSARALGFTKSQWSSRTGYTVPEAGLILRNLAEKTNKRYRLNRADWYDHEMASAARDLGDDGMTFSESAKLLGIKELEKHGDRDPNLFPFGRHPKQEFYRKWLKQSIAHIDDVRKAIELP